MGWRNGMKAKIISETFPDFLREHAKNVEDEAVRSMLLRSANSVERSAKKTKTICRMRNMEAFACFMFDLLMEHNPSFALREELVKIVTILYGEKNEA